MENKNVSFQDTKLANHKYHSKCRVCQSEKLTKYLDLGMLPLPNDLEYTTTQAKDKQRFPLQVLFCEECGLSQLSVVVDPKEMFTYYTYRSSVNQGYVNHCQQMAIDLQNKFDLGPDSFHVDIAGNDGALLKEFKDKIGHKVLNVDPAYNLTDIAKTKGVECLTDYWNLKSAEEILYSKGMADLITATNVFAHVDNVKDFILSAKILLKKNGVLVLEFPYLVDFIEKCEFDTVYFEHLSYFSIIPIMRLCGITGMKIINITKHSIHGGTVRVIIANESSKYQIEESVSTFVNNEIEKGFNKIERYLMWSECSSSIINEFSEKLIDLRKQGFTTYGFAASAKGNTLLNCAKIDSSLVNFIIDETPEKKMKYSPGNGIQITGIETMKEYPPDYVVILSWNFGQEIIDKLRTFYKGKFIIPTPEFQIID